METIEEQIRVLKVKAQKYDDIKSAMSSHLEKIKEHADKLNAMFGEPKIGSRKNYDDELNMLYKKLINGEIPEVFVSHMTSFCGIPENSAQYWFEKFVSFEGVEKIRRGLKVSAIFHLNKSG